MNGEREYRVNPFAGDQTIDGMEPSDPLTRLATWESMPARSWLVVLVSGIPAYWGTCSKSSAGCMAKLQNKGVFSLEPVEYEIPRGANQGPLFRPDRLLRSEALYMYFWAMSPATGSLCLSP